MKKILALSALALSVLVACGGGAPSEEPMKVSGKFFNYKALVEADKSKVQQDWMTMVESLSFRFPNESSVEMWCAYSEGEEASRRFGGVYTQEGASVKYSFDHYEVGSNNWQEIPASQKEYYSNFEAIISGKELTVELWVGGDRSQSFHIILEYKG